MAELTPMMKQYFTFKKLHPDCIILFRLGDFYEMFFDDAIIASKVLEITLTRRQSGLEQPAPMCGVPHHAVSSYITRLIHAGYKVAICDQVEDPALAKGIVKRDITRIITPGTIIEDTLLLQSENNYIVSISFMEDGSAGLCYCDISTGEFCVHDGLSIEKLKNQLVHISPKEIIVGDSHAKKMAVLVEELRGIEPCINPWHDSYYDFAQAHKSLLAHFKVRNLKGFGVDDKISAICAAGALIEYLIDTQKNALIHINKITPVHDSEYMALDSNTCRNLELTQTIMQGSKKGSLLHLLDMTKTAFGARRLRHYVLKPLKDAKLINERLDAVDEIKQGLLLKEELRNRFDSIYDLERIISKLSYKTIDARDCLSLKKSIEEMPAIKTVLKETKSALLKKLGQSLDALEDIFRLLDEAINEEAPAGIMDGGIIKPGYDKEVDRLKIASEDGQKLILMLEQKEKEETGIKNLKIKFNNMFGFFIEVTNSNLQMVPYRYKRKQTLTNCERFITDELKDMESSIIGAAESKNRREYELFVKIRDFLSENIPRIQKTASVIADADVLQSFASVAYERDYVRPEISEGSEIILTDSRHPVVEQALKNRFVPNDVILDDGADNLLLITGPNMSGKSTYMRQTGLIVLMAHMGCFVPAKHARICLVDRIFTRVGASDDLASGQSTFMVEMNELANILNNATEKSLLILDEIGRGTSTIDGLSIAWASAEYILGHIKAKTMFATHYHELVELEHLHAGVKNRSVAVSEQGHEIIFLHKIVEGGTDKSFGIEVARLAGLPDEVIEKSRKFLEQLQDYEISLTGAKPEAGKAETDAKSKPLPAYIKKIRELDINALTPIEALNFLSTLKDEVVDPHEN